MSKNNFAKWHKCVYESVMSVCILQRMHWNGSVFKFNPTLYRRSRLYNSVPNRNSIQMIKHRTAKELFQVYKLTFITDIKNIKYLILATKLMRNGYFPWGGILLLHRSCFGRTMECQRWRSIFSPTRFSLQYFTFSGISRKSVYRE